MPSSAALSVSAIWHRAAGHVERASNMSASVTSSLDILTAQVERLMEMLEKLEQRAGSQSAEYKSLRDKKEALLDEYRKGLFCGGCGQTQSQILAKGEIFPHPGQSIMRPTAEQILAKERELQAPIDGAGARLAQTEKELQENRDKPAIGVTQINAGILLWRTAISYRDAAQSEGTLQVQEQLGRQLREIRMNLESTGHALQTGTPESKAAAQVEMQTWQRLLARNNVDIEEYRIRAERAASLSREKQANERSRIMSYIARGKLHGRTGGPHAIPIYATAIDQEMGASYQMGRLPEPKSAVMPLASVINFCGSYRAYAGENRPGISRVPIVGAIPVADPPARPITVAPTKLLDTLP